jgi:hypothetical protein
MCQMLILFLIFQGHRDVRCNNLIGLFGLIHVPFDTQISLVLVEIFLCMQCFFFMKSIFSIKTYNFEDVDALTKKFK